MRHFVVLALFATTVSWSFAQRSASHAHLAAPAGNGTQRGHATRSASIVSRPIAARGDFARRAFYGPFLLPYGFLADDSSSSEVSESQPLGPLTQSASRATEMPQSTAAPLIIEQRGDRYVRLANEEIQVDDRDQMDASSSANRDLAEKISPGRSHEVSALKTNSIKSAPSTSSPAIAELAPAILIFRDGHSEEVRDYSIIDGVMYARGNYYVDGFWNKQISLTTLNLSETLKSNQARGVRIVIPSSPNEVVTRP